jgi:cytochrome b pre-mRNA-processing protein 3
MILSAFRRSGHNSNIHSLYGAIVAQARSQVFYTQYGVPDSIEGRFELIVLHLVLVLRRLASHQAAAEDGPSLGPGSAVGQRLFEGFCRYLDYNLREMGVGDLAVPRRMRQFGEAFYGRQAAYGAALDAADQRALEKALARNMLGKADAPDRAAALARYVRAAVTRMEAEPEEALVAGKAVFPSAESFVNA